MKSTHKWFIFDLRIALAVYVGFIQLFSHTAQAQSSDPGSLQSQMVQRSVERNSEERRRGQQVAKENVAKKKVKERKAVLNLKDGHNTHATELTFQNGNASYTVLLGDREFDTLVKKASGTQPSTQNDLFNPKNMSLSEIADHMNDIRGDFTDVFGAHDIADDDEWKKMLKNAEKYRQYKEEMQKFESSPLKSHLLQVAKGVEYENISKKNILNERAALQSKKFKEVVHEANMRFPKDTFMFFFAIGAVIAAELWAKHGGDPMAMQHHFDSLTDPIANLSFYTFILANGISLHYLKLGASKKLIDMNNRLIFASLPMISMPFASLVSNIVSDSAMTIKACSEHILKQSPEAAKKKKEEEKDLAYTPCDEALRQWTFANKSNQYLPQLLSLSLSNAPFIALGYATQAAGKKLQVYTFLGAETALVKIGGRVMMTGLKILLSPIPAIALDMMITNPLSTRAWSTASDDIRIDNARDRIFENANRCVWQMQANGSAPLSMPSSCKDLKEDAIILRDRSQSWRSTINSEFETGLQSWTELMLKFNTQFHASQSFYKYVFDEILDFNHTKSLCDKYKVPEACAFMDTVFRQDNFLLTKKFPLVGAKVNSKAFNSSEKGDSDEEYAIKLKNAQSDAALKPKFTMAQFVNIHEQVGRFLANSTWTVGHRLEKEILTVIVKKLQSNNLDEVTAGILEFNILYKNILNNVSGGPFKTALMTLKQGIGDIRPVLNNGEGFLWARSFHSSFDDARTPFEYQYFHGKYGTYEFPTTAHYLLHEMLCGNTKAEWRYKADFGREIGRIDHAYTPPRLIRDVNKIYGFCKGAGDYSLNFKTENGFGISEDGFKFNPTQYLLKAYNNQLFDRMNESGQLFGSYEKDGTFKIKDRETYFGDWWTSANKETMDLFFKEAKEDWGQIYTDLIMSFKNRGYVQDPSQRTTIIKQAKGMMSDNVIKGAVDGMNNQIVPVLPIAIMQSILKFQGVAPKIEYKTQPKNSLEVIQGETSIYFELLKKFNITGNSKITLRKMDAIIDYMQAQNETIDYLQKIFDVGDAKTDVQIENTMKMPDAETIEKYQKALGEALNQLKYFLVNSMTEPLLKSINTDIIYALEGSTNDLNKYLTSANIIGLKDKEALRLLREKAKANQEKIRLNSQGQGVRRGP